MSFFSEYFLPFSLFLINLGIGLSLSFKDFENIFRFPKAVILGLAIKMFLMPLIAYVIAVVSGLPPIMQAGLILIVASPGGATTNFISYICRLNVALSVSLTAINSLITAFTIPFYVNLGLKIFMGQSQDFIPPYFDILSSVVLLTLAPVLIGLYLKHTRPALAERLFKPINRAMLPIFVLAFAGVAWEGSGDGVDAQAVPYLRIIAATVSLNVVGMLAGFFISQLFRLPRRSRTTVGVEVGLQNSFLAVTVASSLLGSIEMATVAVVYGSFTFWSALLFAYFASPHVSVAKLIKTGNPFK